MRMKVNAFFAKKYLKSMHHIFIACVFGKLSEVVCVCWGVFISLDF